MHISKSIQSLSFRLSRNLRPFSTSTYSIEEITVPNGPQYGYKIACKVWKGKGTSDKPELPIVCTHGWLDNAGSFDTLIPKLIRPGRTFYCFDLPGHGYSSHIQTSHYNNHVESHLAIHRVVRGLRLDKYSLMGHSMGGEASIMYAATFPQRVAKVVTFDGVCPCPPDWVQFLKAMVVSMLEVEDILTKSTQAEPSTYDELLVRIMKVRQGWVTEEGCRTLLKRGASEVPGTNGKYRFTHDIKLRIPPGMALMNNDQMTDFCAAVEAPLCVIKAAENDEFSLQASKDFQTAMERAKARNPSMNIEFHTVAGNHHVHLNDSDKVADIVNRFLDS